MRRLNHSRELLDGPLDPRALAANLRDLGRINRWLAGQELSWLAVRALLDELSKAYGGRAIRVLDIGTGAADIPRALVQRARQAGRELEVVASDIRPEIVALAQSRVVGEPQIRVELAHPERLSHADDSFDIVHASLVLHHLEPAAARALLAEAGRVAKRAVIVNDLYRRWHGWLAAWLLTRLATGNRYTRHDGPLSVRRAYQPAEVRALAASADLKPERLISGALGTRYALVLRPADDAS